MCLYKLYMYIHICEYICLPPSLVAISHSPCNINIYIHIYTYTRTFIHTYMCIYTYIYIYTYICVHMYNYISICLYIHIRYKHPPPSLPVAISLSSGITDSIEKATSPKFTKSRNSNLLVCRGIISD